VNDCSRDDTVRLIRKKYRHVSFLKVVHQKDNLGLGAARNRGILESTGQFLAFIDADDVWLPDKLSKQMELFARAGNEYGLCHTFYETIDENGELLRSWEIERTGTPFVINGNSLTPGALAGGNFVAGSGSSVLIRRECIEAIGMFDEDRSIVEDWLLWYKISLRFKILTLPLVLVRIRDHAYGMHKNFSWVYQKNINTVSQMLTLAPPEHRGILEQRRLAFAASLCLRSLPNFKICNALLKKYGLNLLSAMLKKIIRHISLRLTSSKRACKL
jgi:glycosyltransferase involved in cell wall biosynthesis